MEKKQIKKSTAYIVLFLLIALQLARIIFTFTVEKTGQHSDEIWGYGLANSYYKPYLFMTNNEEENTYDNKWVDSEVFTDYISVDEEDRFAYDSVLSNMKIDSHPPLFYLVLHTISSLFPGTYSLWYGFSIGLVCFVVLQIFMFKLGSFLTKSDLWGLLLVAFYGFSVGALNNYVFVRQYSMLTMFGVMLLYYHARVLFAKDKKEFRNALIMLAVSTAGGCLTHYYFIVYAFMHAAVFFCWFALKKQGKKLLSYSLVMLGAVLLTFTVSGAGEMLGFTGAPDLSGGQELDKYIVAGSGIISVIGGMVSSVTDILYDPFFDNSFNTVLGCVLYDLFGLDINPALSYWLIHGAIIVALIGCVFLLASWFIASKSKDVEGRMYKMSVGVIGTIKKINPYQLLLLAYLLAILFEHYIVMGFSNPYVMGQQTNRYIFVTYPAIMLLFVMGVKKLTCIVMSRIENRKGLRKSESEAVGTDSEGQILDNGRRVLIITAAVLLAVSILNNVVTECTYLFARKENDIKLEELVKDKDVVMSLSNHWLMLCYSDILSDADEVFCTTYADVELFPEEIAEYDSEELILIVDVDRFESVAAIRNECEVSEVSLEMLEEVYLEFYKDAYEGKSIEYVLEDTIFMRNIVVYRVY